MFNFFRIFHFIQNYKNSTKSPDISNFSGDIRTLPLFVFSLKLGNGIRFRSNLQLGIFNVGIDFGGVQMLVAQHLLDGFHVHTPGEHQCCRRMPEFMCRILGWVQPGVQNMLLHQPMNGVGGHSAIR